MSLLRPRADEIRTALILLVWNGCFPPMVERNRVTRWGARMTNRILCTCLMDAPQAGPVVLIDCAYPSSESVPQPNELHSPEHRDFGEAFVRHPHTRAPK